ncbi:MAG: glycosyltransferase family 1 [Rariglobus sp.]|jgi:autotransporter-associated beta strand protein|nr:glycosyltransferase family 1 [Rariglobus sp.]
MNTRHSAPSRLFIPRIRPAVIGSLLLSAIAAHAASETWTRTTTGGNWSDTANWLSGTGYANGIDAIATFSATGTQTVNLDTNVTLGSLAFSNGTYTIASSNGSVLTLETSTSTAPNISSTGTISATIAGMQGFTMNPGGNRTLTLSGNNTYTGVTTLANGNLTVRSNNALGGVGIGNGTVVSQSSGQFPQLHFANNVTTSEDITLNMNWFNTTAGATVGGNLIYNDSGTTTLNGTITLNRSAASNANAIHLMGIQSGAGTLNIAGAISGMATGGQASGTYVDPTRLQFRTTAATANINVTGSISNGTLTTGGLSVYTTNNSSGMVRLSGANTYTGSTVHQLGTLLINNSTGSGTGTGAVSVASTAVFGGTGIVKPEGTSGVTFASGALVAPGDLTDSGSAIAAGATLTFDLGSTTGSAVFNSGSVIAINLNAIAATVAESLAFIGLTNGQTQVAFNNNIVNFSITGGLLADGLYTIASFSADTAYTGQWVLGTGLEAYESARLIHHANSIQLAIGAIPEPATCASLAGLVVIGAALARKRRRF